MKDLIDRAEKLFDVFCEDKERREGLETQHGVPMHKLEFDYLESMRSDRKERCTTVDKKWHTEQENASSKIKRREERQNMNSTTVSYGQIDDANEDNLSEIFSDDDDDNVQSHMESDDKTSSSNKKKTIC